MFGLAFDLHLHGRIAIAGPNYFVGNALNLFLHFLVLTAHEALDGIDGIARISDSLALRGISDQALARFGKCHH